MQTERLIYLVTEYASGGEIFGMSTYFLQLILISWLCMMSVICNFLILTQLQVDIIEMSVDILCAAFFYVGSF